MSKPQKPDHLRTIRRRKRVDPPPQEALTPDAVNPVQVASPEPEPQTPVAPEPPVESLDGNALLAEIESMGADAFAALMEGGAPTTLAVGDKVSGTVVRVTADTVFLNVGAKAEGFMDRTEFGETPPVTGSELTAYILQIGDSIQLSKQLQGEASWEGVAQAHEAGIPVEGRVDSTNPGGLVVRLGDVRAFCPISHIERNVPSDLSTYVGRTLMFMILELKDKEVVVSHRQIADAEREALAESRWNELKEGQTLDGVVSNVREFGVFVDIGGIEGLVPRSELGWSRDAKAPDPGSQVQVRVLSVNILDKRLSLSLKDSNSDPWSQVGRSFLPGGIYTGKVTRLTDFGAFISLAPGLEGLAHISRLSSKRIGHPREVLEQGQEVQIRIEEIDAARQRLSLAIPKEGDEEGQTQAHQSQPEQSLGTLADLFGGIKLTK